MAIREQIAQIMQQNPHLSLRWLAGKSGLSYTTLYKYLSGDRNPRDPAVWDSVLDVLKKHIPGLADELAAPQPAAQQLRPLAPMPMVRIPIVATAKGGRGDSDQIDDSLEVPVTFSQPDYRALVALGDSQADEILGGDTIIVKQTPERKPRVISCILVGSELLLKKLEWNSKENRWEMLSKNGAYPPEPLPLDAVIQGYVVGVYRTDGSGIGFDMKYDPTGLRFGSW
jgi:hypothetical protein